MTVSYNESRKCCWIWRSHAHTTRPCQVCGSPVEIVTVGPEYISAKPHKMGLADRWCPYFGRINDENVKARITYDLEVLREYGLNMGISILNQDPMPGKPRHSEAYRAGERE